MAQKRSEFYKALNQMRDSNQSLGNPLINNVDDTTAVGSELSSFAYKPKPTEFQTIESDSAINWTSESQIQEAEDLSYAANRNIWQRIGDTIQDAANNIAQGTLNFVDGIINASAYASAWLYNHTPLADMQIGNRTSGDLMEEAARLVMDYDWQQHVLNLGQQMNFANAILTGDMFGGEYWQNWADTFTLDESRKNLDKTKTSSYQSELGEFGSFLQSAEEGVGYVLPSVIVGIATGGASVPVQAGVGAAMTAVTGISAFGSGTSEALKDGADFNQAGQSGLVSAGIEMGTEALSFGLGKGIGKILGKATTFGTRLGGATFGQQLGKLTAKEIGKAALEEGTEEFLSEVLSPLAKQVYKDDAIEKAWFSVGSDENIEMLKNALVSFGAGAVGGAFGAGVQGTVLTSKISNKGIDLANNIIEAQALHERAINEANKGANANQKLISQYENRIGELTKNFVNDMESFEKSNPKEFKNLMEMFKDPQSYVENLKIANPNLTNEQITEYKNSYVENYSDIIEQLNEDTYKSIAKLNSTKDNKIEIGNAESFSIENFTDEYLQENGIRDGEVVRAYYDKDTKTTYINPLYKAQFFELAAHESISHGVLDTNEKVKNQLIKSIESDTSLSELYHKHDTQLRELYGVQGENVVESERLATFIENFVKNKKTYNRVLRINQGNKLLSILNKIKNAITITKGNKFLSQLEKAIESVENSIEISPNTYKPRYAYSKVYKEVGKATGVEVHADIIKDSAQAFQSHFVNLSTVESIYKGMLNATKEMLNAKGISLSQSRYRISRQTFVDFNQLLNKPEQLRAELGNAIDEFLGAKITYSNEYLVERDIALDKKTDITLEEILKLYGEDINAFKESSVVQLEKVLKEQSKKTKIQRVREYYKERVVDLVDKVNNYKQLVGDIIRSKSYFDKGKQFLLDNKARATKVGDTYIAKLDFYKKIFSGDFKYSKSTKNVSPATITRIVNALDTYTEDNIRALGGVWTTDEEVGVRGVSNESIKTSSSFLKGKFVNDKFPSRALTIEEMEHVRNILYGINMEMREFYSKEGIARQQATFEADLELRVIDSSAKKAKMGFFEKELNYTISMNSVLASFFGSESAIHKILYDDVFASLDKKYLQESVMRNELQELLISHKLWDKVSSSPSRVFSKKVDFAGKKIPLGIIMDMYAQTLTTKGLSTLQKGGYSYMLDKGQLKEHIVFTLDMLDELESLLTSEQRSFVEELVYSQYNGSWKSYKQEKDTQIRSFSDVLEGEVYYPTNKADTNGKGLEQANFQNLDLSDQSFNKRRAKNTDHLSLMGMDIINRARSYIDGLSKYGEMTQTLKMFDSLLKQWTTDHNGNSMSRDSLFSQNIPNWQEYKNYLIGQITGTNKGVLNGKFFGAMSSATLFGNISVVLKQTASLPTMLLEISPKSWVKALSKGWKNLAKYKTTKAFIEAQSGIAAQRWADFDSVKAESLQKELSKIGRVFGIPMEKMDESVIVIFGWQAAQEEARIKTGYKIGSPENNRVAIEILNKIIANTQSNSISINMSMARSGNAGYLRKIMTLFGSDLQNKTSRMAQLLYEAKYAKQRIKSLETFEANAQNELDIAKQELESFKVDNKAVENFAEEVARLESVVESKQSVFDMVKNMKARETKILSSGRRVKESLKYLLAVLMSALMVAGIDQLIQRLYGRKGWNENTLQDFGTNLLLESTISNLPYVSSIVNAIEYGTDIGGYDFTIINNAVDIMKDIKTMVESGKFNPGFILNALTTLGQLSGIPFKNIYNLIMGVYKNIDKSGYKAEAIIKGYSDTYIRKAYREQLENEQLDQANAYLELLMSSYKVGNFDSAVNSEIMRLEDKGYSVLPKNFMTSYEDESGNMVDFTEQQRNDFVSYYGMATSDIRSLIANNTYQSLDDEYKAKTVKKIYDTYYEYAKARVLKVGQNSKQVSALLLTKGNLKMGKYIPVLTKLNIIEASKNETRKELVLKEINKLKGYSKQEKLLIIWLCGYSLTKENKVSLGNLLIKNGAKKSEVLDLIK